MTQHSQPRPSTPAATTVRSCPGGDADHILFEPTDDEARVAGLPVGQRVHIDRSRLPATGDLVWVELVRHGSTQRLIRRYASDADWVTLSAPSGDSAAIMRRASELLILGVIDEAAGGGCTTPPGA